MVRRFAKLLAIVALLVLVLLSAAPGTSQASFPGYNGQIAFAAHRVTLGNFDIWTMGPDGRHPTKLTDTPLENEIEPDWSPDGERIAYTEANAGEIFVVDVRSGETMSATGEVGGYASSPAWSPDGSRIAFSVSRRERDEIYVVDADGANPANLTNTSDVSESRPAWSPDGRKIAYGYEGENAATDIYVMNADGSHPVALTEDGPYDSWPAWSPDGDRIAFATDRIRGARLVDVFVMNSDGTDVKQMVFSNDPSDMPEWSPDGQFLLYVDKRESQQGWELVRLPVDGGPPQRLTGTEGADWFPSWQAASTPAPDSPGRLAVSPPSGVAGSIVTVTGNNCGEPGDALTIGFEGAPGRNYWGYERVGTVMVGADGTFAITYSIPPALKWFMRPMDALVAGQYGFFADPYGCEVVFRVEEDAEWTAPVQYEPYSYNYPPGTMPLGGGRPGGGADLTPVAAGAGMVALSLVMWAAALRRRRWT